MRGRKVHTVGEHLQLCSGWYRPKKIREVKRGKHTLTVFECPTCRRLFQQLTSLQDW